MKCSTAISVFFFSMLSAFSQSETLWVNDVVYVPLRSGPSNQHRILHKGLISGTALKTVGGNENGWVQVKTDSGLEGWLPKQYLLNEPTASIKVEKAEKEASEAKDQLQTLRAENKQLTAALEKNQCFIIANRKRKTAI